MTASLDVAEIRAALETRAVLDFYGWQARRSGDELESMACPQRSDHSRRAFVINARSGRWQCFPCSAKGDLFDFIAEVERLDIESEFTAVLERAAEIAGVGPSLLTDDERRQRKAEVLARRAADEQRAREERAARDRAAVVTATAYWQTLPAAHPRGAAYLRERGLAAALPLGLVRYDLSQGGSPALPLHGSDGTIRNVVRRRLPELGEPKTPGLVRCPTAGTLVHSVGDIAAMRWDAVVTEGVFDSITAAVAWRDVVVLGAHGAGNLPKLVGVAAKAAAAAGTRLFLVPHNDDAGYRAVAEAGELALEAGLSIRRGTLRIVKHGEKDLNDAWRQGWRPPS